MKGRNFTKFWGRQRFPYENFVSVNFVSEGSSPFFSHSSSAMVLGPVSYPAETQYTTVFALRNGKFSRLGGDTPLYPLKLHP